MSVPITQQDGEVWLNLQIISKVKKGLNASQGFSSLDESLMLLIGKVLSIKLQQVIALSDLR